MSANRLLIRILASCAVCSIFLIGMTVGCNGGGKEKPPFSISFRGVETTNYNSTIPLVLWIQSGEQIHVALALVYSEGVGQDYKPTTPLPGTVNPVSIRKLLVPAGGTEILFWWHAVADLVAGQNHNAVFLKAIITLDDGTSAEAFVGPLEFDYSSMQNLAPPPYVQGGALPDTRCGEAYGTELPVTGGQEPLVWTLWPPGSQLPYFLELTHDGRIRGNIPDDYGPLTVSFVAMVTDSSFITPRRSAGLFTIFIDCVKVEPCAPEPEILFSTIPNAKEEQSYLFQATAAAGEGTLHWTVASGTLPPGFDFSSSGLLSGVPAEGTAGTYDFELQVCDSCPEGQQCDTVQIALTVEGKTVVCDPAPSITTTTLPNAREGDDYAQAIGSTGGHGSKSWLVIQGALPQGISLTSGGVLHGIPGTGTGGTAGINYDFTVQVCDSCPLGAQCDTQALTLNVAAPLIPCADPPQITSANPLPDATENEDYSFQFSVTGGEGGLTWEITNLTEVPTGMNFNAQGLLSGIPDFGTAGTHELHVKVSDSCDEVQSDSGAFFLTVVGIPCADPPQITTLTVPSGKVGVAYDTMFQASGGEGDLTWTQIGGPALPTGLTLETTGQLHGTPAAGTASTYDDIEIQVADSCPGGAQTAGNLYNLVIEDITCADPPQIQTTALPPGGEGVEYNQMLIASDGEGTLTWEVLGDGDTLPLDLVLDANGTLSGTPVIGTAGTYDIHFQVCDSCTLGAQCDDSHISLEIKPPCAPAPEITTTSIPAAIVGTPYSFQFEGTGGEGQLRWVLKNIMGLPLGWMMSLDGLLTGDPSLPQVGEYSLSVVLSDSCFFGPQSDEGVFNLVIQE
jgi:hypothetical protein